MDFFTHGLLEKVLMCVVHQDDECLSAGGTLLQCEDLHLLYFNKIHPDVDEQQYERERRKVTDYLGCTASWSGFEDVNRLDLRSQAEFVNVIENTINFFRPTTLILPFPSYNSDHRVVFEAGITASRVHDKNWFVKNVIVAEQPETLQTNRLEPQFRPELFIPINVNEKLNLYHLYESQQRAHRSDHYIRSLAGVRGAQCNQVNAEAFQVVRLCITS